MNPVFQKCQRVFLSMPKGKLLDVGCSDGEFDLPLLKEGWEVHGIDLAGAVLDKARGRGVKVRDHDITTKWPYKDDAFDYVFAGEVIEHLLDTDFFLRECNRVLKNGGTIILTTPNFSYIRHRIEMLFGKYPACMWPRFEAHIRLFTHHQLRSDAEKHGFVLERWLTSYFLFSRARVKKIGLLFETLPDLYPPFMSSQIIAVMKKKEVG